MPVKWTFLIDYYYVSNRHPPNCLFFFPNLLHRTFLYSLKINFFRNSWQYIFKEGKILSLVDFPHPKPILLYAYCSFCNPVPQLLRIWDCENLLELQTSAWKQMKSFYRLQHGPRCTPWISGIITAGILSTCSLCALAPPSSNLLNFAWFIFSKFVLFNFFTLLYDFWFV